MTSHCKKIEHYLDGSLCERKVLEFESHLDLCTECQRVISVDIELDDLIRESWNSVSAPSGLTQTRAKLQRRDSKNAYAMAAVLGVAATILIAITASIILESGSPKQQHNMISKNDSANSTVPNADKNHRSELNVVVLDVGQDRDALLVVPGQQNRSFTIVKAFRPLQLNTTGNYETKEIENEQTN